MVAFHAGQIINQEYIRKKDVEYVHCQHNVTYQNGALLANLSAQTKVCRAYDHQYLDWGPICTPFGNGTLLSNQTGPFVLTDDAFGFKSGTPCIMVRLNRINMWRPSPKALTAEKKKEYGKLGVTFRPDWESKVNNFPNQRAYIWVHCDGFTEEDRELIGDIRYFPRERPALPKIYFPFNGQPCYLAPFIFIQFLNPTVRTVLRVQCVAVDNNINLEQHQHSVVGTINFELLID